MGLSLVPAYYRVWKGILGIRDLTKIRCGIRENENILTGFGIGLLPGKRDLPKFWDGKRDFAACLSGIREIVTTQISVMAAKANQPGERKISIERASFCRN